MSSPYHWPTRGTLLMGVLNVTPDSFSDGGRFVDLETAAARAADLIAAGADIIDIGGESSRPGAAPVSPEEELRRVLPVVRRLCGGDSRQPPSAQRPFVVSVDTTKAAVAAAALAAGARIVNDISALRFEPALADVVAGAGAGLVLMHMQGTPQTMQQEPRYTDVVRDVTEFLADRLAAAEAAGIDRRQIAVDPGLGFGKTVEHNLTLLARLEELQGLGCAVAVGPSRKSFIGRVLDRDVDRRLWGTAATVAWAAAHGARLVRVHDLPAMADVVRMTEAIRQWNR